MSSSGMPCLRALAMITGSTMSSYLDDVRNHKQSPQLPLDGRFSALLSAFASAALNGHSALCPSVTLLSCPIVEVTGVIAMRHRSHARRRRTSPGPGGSGRLRVSGAFNYSGSCSHRLESQSY